MRARLRVQGEDVAPGAAAALRVYALGELHRVLHGYTAYIDEVELVATRERGASPRWRVEARVTLWDHAAFEVTAQAARPHGAVDEVAHDAWLAMRARVRGDAPRLGRVA